MFDINRVIIFLCIGLMLLGCSSDKNQAAKKSEHIVTVSFKPMTRMLYFNGTIKPLSVAYVVSPVEGTVEKKEFQYGQLVKAGAVLLTIGSSKLETDYQAALVQYLKAKDKYLNDQAKFANTQELMRNDLIAKETFDTEKQTLASSRFDYLQAQLKMETLLKKETNLRDEDISLKDIAAAEKALRMQLSAQQIISPREGIVLFPLKSEGGPDSGGGGGLIEAGSPVKANQVLLMIGDLSGISMDIQVGEQDVDQVKVGQSVTVTGPAFSEFTLKGVVKSVGAQAKTTSSGTGAPPVFAVEVVVSHLTGPQRKQIQVGMSAKIALALPAPQVLLLPVKAVFEKEGGHWVKVLDPNTKREKDVLVKTGKTTLTDVVIESGLEPGMQVLVP